MRPGRIRGAGRRACLSGGRAYSSRLESDPGARRADSGGRILVQRPLRPMRVVVIGVLIEDQPQMPLPGDQHPVQALAAGAGDPAFGDSVRARRPDRGLNDPHADRGEQRVERRDELGIPVTDQELQAARLTLKVHQEVTGPLSHPRAGGVGGDPGQVHAGGAMLDDEQHVQAAQEHGIDVEEVRSGNRLCLPGQERTPGLPGAPGGGIDARVLEDLPHRQQRERVSQAGQSRAGPGPPSSGSGDAAAAAAGLRAGCAGSRSPRFSMSPHAGTAAATQLAA